LELHGKKEDLRTLIEELQPRGTQSLVSFTELANALRKRDIACHFLSIGLLDIPNWPSPVIAHLDGNHFAVLTRSEGDELVLWDGLRGARATSWFELKRRASSVYLLTSPARLPASEHAGNGLRSGTCVAGAFLILVAMLLMRIRSHPGHAGSVGVQRSSSS